MNLFFKPLAAALLLLICPAIQAADKDGWVALFNGKDLDGWTPKIRGHEAGDNFADTFRVEDGVLKVSYDKYKQFDNKFGHLFHKNKLSHYVLRIEYRFVGDQCKGGPGWAVRNSGVMLHCQSPQSMRKDQEFPVSIEAQFLGGNGKDARPTGNVCTPGTLIEMNGKLITPHCTNSKSKTFHGDRWVTAEIEVHGGGKVRHLIDGELVLEYDRPQLDPKDADAAKLIVDNKVLLEEGYIALQAESHPVEFRKVEVKSLTPATAEANTLTEQEKKDGWKLLFDGRSLDGWRRYNKQDAQGWTVKDGTLYLEKSGSGDLMTKEKYGDFELSLEWKFESGNNSGVIYRAAETKGPAHVTGPEMQVMTHKPADKLGKNSGGSLYDLYAPTSNPFKGADEWATFKVVARGKKLEQWVNGTKVVDVEIGSDDWNKRLAMSKWKNEKGFAAEPSGHIVLQDHGAKIHFRNIKLRPLDGK